MKKLLLALALVVLTSCAGSPNTTSYKIGAIMPLTGPHAEIGGVHHREGIEVAIEQINKSGGVNGKPLEVIYQDAPWNPREAVTAYQQLTQKHNLEAVFMTSYSGFLATSPLAEKDQQLLVNIFDSSEPIAKSGEYSIATGVYDEGIGMSAATFARKHLEKTKAIVVYNTGEEFLHLCAKGFQQAFKDQRGKIVQVETYPIEETDFRSLLSKVKAQDFDILVLLSFDEGGLFLRQMRELGMNQTVIGVDTFSTDGFKKNAGENLDQAYYTFWEPETSTQLSSLNQGYKAMFGKENESIFFTALGYDAIHIVKEGLEQKEVGEHLKDAIHRIKDLPVVSGSFTLSDDGINRGYTENILFQFKGTKEEEITRLEEL